jgi:outer membrane biosynthesis protein TonB
MKLIIVFVFGLSLSCLAQEPLAESKFHEGSQFYINGNRDAALASVNQGLRTEPGNPKLTELKKLLEEDKKKQEQEKKDKEQKEKQDKKDQQKKEQDKKDQEKKEQDKKDDKDSKDKKDQDKKDKEEQEKKDKEKKEQEKKDKDAKEKKEDIPPSVSDKLKEMQMSEEKAKMILEAMKNQEIQYLQQNKRKATKPKDKGKPDW